MKQLTQTFRGEEHNITKLTGQSVVIGFQGLKRRNVLAVLKSTSGIAANDKDFCQLIGLGPSDQSGLAIVRALACPLPPEDLVWLLSWVIAKAFLMPVSWLILSAMRASASLWVALNFWWTKSGILI